MTLEEQKELASLRADSARMNWLEKKLQYRRARFAVVRPIMGVAVNLDDTSGALRATIDHAMREDSLPNA